MSINANAFGFPLNNPNQFCQYFFQVNELHLDLRLNISQSILSRFCSSKEIAL